MSRKPSRDSVQQPTTLNTVEQLLQESLDEEVRGIRKPWAIKGIDEATIQLCKLAARGKGMKINRWVADALSNAAQEQFGYARTDQRPAADFSDVLTRLSRLEGEVNALSKSHAAIVSAVVSK